MNDGRPMFEAEESIARLSVNFGKIEYLLNVLSQKFEKRTNALTSHEKEIFLYERENMRTNLDILEDYLHDSSRIVKELQEGMQHG